MVTGSKSEAGTKSEPEPSIGSRTTGDPRKSNPDFFPETGVTGEPRIRGPYRGLTGVSFEARAGAGSMEVAVIRDR